MKFATKLIHAGQTEDPATGAVSVPVYQTSTFRQDAIGETRGWEYSRTANPTRAALENCLAQLEGAKYGLAFSSGMAAVDAVLRMLRPGDHIVAGEDLYGGTFRLLEEIFRKTGIEISYASGNSPQSFQTALKPNTKMLWLETPSNPLLSISDIAAVAKIAHGAKALLIADNTFATPAFQQPLALGADIVVHSATKYLGGHSDVLGGAVITSDKNACAGVKFIQKSAGAVPGPWDSWLMLRGIKTLSLRMRAHEQNALEIAKFLSQHHAISKVYYPGLKNHPGHKLAAKQMSGFGGIVSCELKNGEKAARKFAKSLKLFALAESLGGVESLACYPSTMTHASMNPQERLRRGITPGLMRLSAGIEDCSDLIEDLKNSLK
jgi:cystathionine gamma-synthase/cystathionine gamma-lyase